MDEQIPFKLAEHPVHLGLGATVSVEEAFTGAMDWYERYSERHVADGVEGRLVSLHRFDESWRGWEMHPGGHELVVCVEGVMTLHQEVDGAVRTVVATVGEAVVNPPGVWHTMDVDGPAVALFITAGEGTQLRPR
jgi:quercetin dioxygenase-like cupin family protein